MASEISSSNPLNEDLKYDPEDRRILQLFDDIVRNWWIKSFSGSNELFTLPQRLAIPVIHEGNNVLICSPTGSGKTLSAFISIINQLFVLARNRKLENGVYCVYISPLKSLANDINKNLEYPLSEIQAEAIKLGIDIQEIKHAIRHGDVSARDKSKMLNDTPHILNTTPESLSILLSSPKFREKLKTVRWVIVDEIHYLAGSKRGVHLSISLERLEELKMELCEEAIDPEIGSFTRIGCSATIEPLIEIADFLAGNNRHVEIVDARFSRKFDLKLLCPVADLISVTSNELNDILYDMIHRYIQKHNNTLIFANTRNGAERVLYNLRARFPQFYSENNSGCHHSSMGKKGRIETENRLKKGSLKVVCSSTSLELGIDMPYIDLVIQIGSPKSVAALLQRIGRAGHSLERLSKGRIIALDRDDLLECAVMLDRGIAGLVDSIHIPENCLDALCQHLLGMTLEKTWDLDDVSRIVKRSYCYRNLEEEDLKNAVKYLSGKYAGLEERRIYSKIWYDEEKNKIGKLGRNASMIYYTNTGMIPDQFSCNVLTREGCWIGNLDENYLEKLNKGDVFVIGGRSFRFCYRRAGNIYADITNDRPNIPNWVSEKLPLSFDMGRSILRFKNDMLWMMRMHASEEVIRWLMKQYPIDENSARAIHDVFLRQIQYLGEDSVSTDRRMVIEKCLDHNKNRQIYYFQTNYGAKFNDGFSKMIAYMISQEKNIKICLSITDSGFMLSLPENIKVDIHKVFTFINEKNCEDLLRNAIQNTNLLKNVFRINATRAFMILRSYMGRKRSARGQQARADMLICFARRLNGFAPLKESFREIIEDKFEVENIKEFLKAVESKELEVVLKEADSPSPMAFEIASLASGDVIFAEDRLNLLNEFHKRVIKKCSARGY